MPYQRHLNFGGPRTIPRILSKVSVLSKGICSQASVPTTIKYRPCGSSNKMYIYYGGFFKGQSLQRNTSSCLIIESLSFNTIHCRVDHPQTTRSLYTPRVPYVLVTPKYTKQENFPGQPPDRHMFIVRGCLIG